MMTKANVDFIFLGLLALSIAATLTAISTTDYILSYYHYAAFAFWAITLALRLIKPQVGRYVLCIMLALATINFINFSTVRTTSAFGFKGLGAIRFDPYMFLLLIIFYFVNKTSVNRIVQSLFRGNEKEQEAKQQKMVDFYLQKFSDCPPEEFEKIYTKISDYPHEAQIALKQIYLQQHNPATL